jgi:hypothetical protein
MTIQKGTLKIKRLRRGLSALGGHSVTTFCEASIKDYSS